MSSNTNPGNFSNRAEEEVQNIARKGGQSSHTGGFASMDPDKQVCTTVEAINEQSK
jgi:general stress protein YciG